MPRRVYIPLFAFAILATPVVLATLADEGPPAPAQVRENPKGKLKYVWIPPGSFTMGCSPDETRCQGDQKPSHRVTISRGFWIGQTEVTVGAYKRFGQRTGRSMPREADQFGRPLNPGWGNDSMPIVNLTWRQAQAYCNWAGGRLPTEAEWEYSARGGNASGRYGALDEVAWYADNSGRERLDSTTIIDRHGLKAFPQHLIDNGNSLHQVAQKRPNGFGLFDVLGNVSEWVNDWFDSMYYRNSPPQDPPGPVSGRARVRRGGSWSDPPWPVTVSFRNTLNPRGRYADLGLRCTRDAE